MPTDAGQDMLNHPAAPFNRQASSDTQELAEIVGGAEASKDSQSAIAVSKPADGKTADGRCRRSNGNEDQ